MNIAKVPRLVPGPRGYRVSDLRGLPLGPHYELIDGCVIASPPPSAAETALCRWLAHTFEIANRGSPLVVDRGQRVCISEYDEVCPDIVVADVAQAERTPIPVEAVALIVEVTSPVSALRDVVTKNVMYGQSGVPAYWTVTRRPDPPSLLVTEMRRDDATGGYVVRTPPTSAPFSTDYPWRFTVDVPAIATHDATLGSWVDGRWEVS